jgi:hypothetical protein
MIMVSERKVLTREEFASLLTVGGCTVQDPPPTIPAQHSARLIRLGYMADMAGRLRMTTPGRQRIAAGFRQVGNPKQGSRSVDSGVG